MSDYLSTTSGAKKQPRPSEDKMGLRQYKAFIVQVLADPEISLADVKVAAVLWYSFNWRQGICYAGFENILERTSLSSKSVWRSLRRLLDRKHIGFVGDRR